MHSLITGLFKNDDNSLSGKFIMNGITYYVHVEAILQKEKNHPTHQLRLTEKTYDTQRSDS